MVVKRAHTNANIAPAIRRLRDQVNAAYPKRSKVTDGIWPSAAHTAASPNSDHEAGNAIDITADLGGADVKVVYDAIKGDPRVSYLIYSRRIWSHDQGERTYAGPNPHTSHMHVSVRETHRADARDWSIGGVTNMGYKWVFGYFPAEKVKLVEDYCKARSIKLVALQGMGQGRVLLIHHRDDVADAFIRWAENIGGQSIRWYRSVRDNGVRRLNSPSNTVL